MTNNLTVKQPVRQFNSAELIIGLQTIPSHWALTPVNGQKRPYRFEWQSEKPLDRSKIVADIKSGRAKGYGIRTGKTSDGLLAIDADGDAAEELLRSLSGGDLPDTVTFSSGKPGRRQLLYAVPQEFWGVMKTIKLNTNIKDDKGKWQHLEFRWDGSQSVLPPSVHPETGAYFWMRTPQEVEVAPCPMWVVELIINHNQNSQTASNTTLDIPFSGSERAPLEIFLGKDDQHLVENGTGDGGRNHAAQKLSLNLVATARRLSELGIPFEGDPQVLYEQFCDRCNPPLSKREAQGWWRNADAIATRPSLDDEKLQVCYKAWLKRNKVKSNTTDFNHVSIKSIGNVANSLLATPLATPQDDDESITQAIGNVVNAILNSPHGEFVKRKKLDDTYTKYMGVISRELFNTIVSSKRVKVEEVLPEDEVRLKSLMAYSQARIDWDYVLPALLARDIKHDADERNIDPVMIWQALLSATSSLAGHIKLDKYGGVPAINWTVTVAESGEGKSRADKLVLAPLRKMQSCADRTYKNEAERYRRAIKQHEKSGDTDSSEPEKPALRKYLFGTATIQAVLKRLSEQGEHGSLWARDEFKGLFSSLNQFSGQETEATEIILSLWDGSPIFVDRADFDNSYSIPATAVSLTGGIQPSVFRKAFKDAEDGNGMQARFLFAVPEKRKKKDSEKEGFCYLSESLPALYGWLDNLAPRTVKMAPEARKYFSKLVDIIADQIEQVSHAGIRTWMNKLDTHVLRIALILHLIECYYSPSTTDLQILSLPTLKRAVVFAQYYRSAFHVLQEKVSVSDDIASIMLQIHSAALNKHPDGISARDVYRDSRPIKNRAKSAGREVGAYVSDLFEKMAQMGYGEIVRKGRSVRFVAFKQNSVEEIGGGVANDDNKLESLPEDDEDRRQSRCQLPIGSVANKNFTEARRSLECPKEPSNNEQQEPLVDNVQLSTNEEQTTQILVMDKTANTEQVPNNAPQPADNAPKTAPSPEDFAPGMEVIFNRQLASQSSSQRIPASVTRGVVVKIGISTVLVQWEGLEQAQHHQPIDLDIT